MIEYHLKGIFLQKTQNRQKCSYCFFPGGGQISSYVHRYCYLSTSIIQESNRWFNGPPGVFEFYSTNIMIISICYTNYYSIQSIHVGSRAKFSFYIISELLWFIWFMYTVRLPILWKLIYLIKLNKYYFIFYFLGLFFVLFCFVLFFVFCFVLFCLFVCLFVFVLFCFVLFCFVLFCFVLFCFVFVLFLFFVFFFRFLITNFIRH